MYKFRAALWLEESYVGSIRGKQRKRNASTTRYGMLLKKNIRYIQIVPTAARKTSIFGLVNASIS